jgi:hypothetical protein
MVDSHSPSIRFSPPEYVQQKSQDCFDHRVDICQFTNVKVQLLTWFKLQKLQCRWNWI